MNILAENGEFNLIENDTHWIFVWKTDGKELNRCSKVRNPIFPIAAVAKWGYTPVDTVRRDEIIKSYEKATKGDAA